MSYQKESFGMMDEGYFVPRGELIDWINNLLDLNITKIQQLGAGSIYCQIVDVIHPGKVAMNKVNWKAKSDYEFINNLKVLQTAFDKAGVKRYVDVQKLAKAKYQDNLQFIQWLKRYYDLNCGDRGNDYNAKERRGNVAVDLSFAEKNVVPKSFNSGGQMVAKTDLPGKKTNPIVGNKSSVVQTKIQPKVVQQKPAKVVQKATTAVQKKRQQKPVTKTQKTANSQSKNDFEALYKKEVQKNKDLNLKIGMVEEVLRSNDDCQMKIAMLEQIIGVVREKVETAQQHVEVQDFEVQATDHQEDQVI